MLTIIVIVIGTQDFKKEILFPNDSNNIDDAFQMEAI